MLRRSDGQKVDVDLRVEGLSDELEKAARNLITEYIGAMSSEAEALARVLKALGVESLDELGPLLGRRP